MKVLHVIPAVAARYGGPSRAIFEMCRALEQQGTEVLIASTDADGAERIQVDCGNPITFQGQQSVFFRKQWSEAFKFSRPLARWLASNVIKFDVVHIHAVFSHACLAAAAACRLHRVPYIIRPLGTLDPWSLGQKRLRKQIMFYMGVKGMLKHAAAVHYTARDEKDLAELALRLKRGFVIPLGIDSTLFQSVEPDGAFRDHNQGLGTSPYILALCRLHPKKGLELLIETFAEIIKSSEFAQWKLVLLRWRRVVRGIAKELSQRQRSW